MFEIYDGRKKLWQWDSDIRLIVDELTTDHKVHFSNKTYPESLPVDVYEYNGKLVCDVPNELLQCAETLTVYTYLEDEDGKRTIHEKTIGVDRKKKQSDYVYTPTEVRDFDALKALVFEKELYISEYQETGSFTTKQSEILEKTLEIVLGRIPVEFFFIPTTIAWCSILSKSITIDEKEMKAIVTLQVGGLGNTDHANIGGHIIFRSDKDADAEAYKAFLDEVNTFLDEVNREVI